jgi:2-polyprenyl-6-methoxyphenol hydroxylase-like FAD-dependent oxidoreductase
MPDTNDPIDVLIAGAGPTGLALAGDLLARGVRVRLVDAAEARSPHSRAMAVQARTLELLARFGLADTLVARGRRMLGARIFVRGREAADLRLGDVGAEDTQFPFVLFVSQAETEAVLEERVVREGGKVERPLRLTGLVDEGPFATATLADAAGREERVRARYVAGCDGAHSAVRRAAAIDFRGARYEEDFVLADTAIDWKGPAHRVSFFLGDPGFAAVFPMRGGVYRVIGSFGSIPEGAKEPTLQELQENVARVAGMPLVLKDPRWLTRFRLHHRGADRYRRGRAFVLGDAAHIHSPAGGQGMNTGIQDATNLGWKLALVLQGRAREDLLDSYEEERLPVGRNLLRFTDRAFSFLASSRRPLVAARNLLAPRLLGLALSRYAPQAWIFRFVSQLAIRYTESSIVEERAGGPGLQGLVAGCRAPDAPLIVPETSAATSVHAQTAGTEHHLFLFAGPEAEDLPRLAQTAREVLETSSAPTTLRLICPETERAVAPEGALLDPGGAARGRFGLRAVGGHVLVRPDGYIGFREEGHDFGALARHLHRLYPRA